MIKNTNYIHISLSLVEMEICDRESYLFSIIVKLKKN